MDRMSAADYRKKYGASDPQGERLDNKGRSKYGNKPVTRDGKRFDSTGEATYFEKLRCREERREIHTLKRQPRYPLYSHTGECIGEYIGDYEFVEDGKTVCEDFKGVKTAIYKWKIKHAKADYPHIQFREVKA